MNNTIKGLKTLKLDISSKIYWLMLKMGQSPVTKLLRRFEIEIVFPS